MIGCGSVGQSLLRLLDAKESALAEADFSWQLTAVVTARRGLWLDTRGISATDVLARIADGRDWPDQSGDHGTQAVQAILDADAADVVIESTPLDPHTGEPALGYLRVALGAGVSVVTANKGPIAHAYAELRELAERTGAWLAFESTVLDGAPLFSLVARTLPVTRINGLRGLLNSTSNYVLDQVRAGVTPDNAVRRAQEEGVAEADPSLDLDGWDAATKLSVLSHVLLGVRLRPADIPKDSWPPPPGSALQRQVSSLSRGADGEVLASVRWTELDRDDPLSVVRDLSSALTLQTDTLGELTITILDPTTDQTAYGVLADLVAMRAVSAAGAVP
jgi:homoserine dehydrogenase